MGTCFYNDRIIWQIAFDGKVKLRDSLRNFPVSIDLIEHCPGQGNHSILLFESKHYMKLILEPGYIPDSGIENRLSVHQSRISIRHDLQICLAGQEFYPLN